MPKTVDNDQTWASRSYNQTVPWGLFSLEGDASSTGGSHPILQWCHETVWYKTLNVFLGLSGPFLLQNFFKQCPAEWTGPCPYVAFCSVDDLVSLTSVSSPSHPAPAAGLSGSCLFSVWGFFFFFAAHFPSPDFAPIKHSFYVCLIQSDVSWPLPRLYSNDPPYKVMIKIKIIIQTNNCYFRCIYPPTWYKSPWKLLSFVKSLAGRSLWDYTIWGLHY